MGKPIRRSLQRIEVALRRLTWRAGLAGVSAIMVGILVSAIAYSGRKGEPCNPLNHFVSELGEIGVSDAALAFNSSLVVAGLCFTVFLVGVAVYLRSWFSFVFGGAGLVTGVSGLMVGLLPMNNLEPHIIAAMTFFNSGMVTMGLFSAHALLSRQRRFPRSFSVAGILVTAVFALFLYLPSPSEPTGDLAEATSGLLENRPGVWLVAMLEWLVVLSVVVWVAAVAFYLRLQDRRTEGK